MRKLITSAAVMEDDDGSVTLTPASPEVGDTVTATLSDPDGGVMGAHMAMGQLLKRYFELDDHTRSDFSDVHGHPG